MILWTFVERFSFHIHISVEGGSGEWEVGISGVLVGNWFKNVDTVSWGSFVTNLSVNIIFELSVVGGSLDVDSVNVV